MAMKNTKNMNRITETIKDRQSYRDVLINRKEELEAKIKRVELSIKDLRAGAGASA